MGKVFCRILAVVTLIISLAGPAFESERENTAGNAAVAGSSPYHGETPKQTIVAQQPGRESVPDTGNGQPKGKNVATVNGAGISQQSLIGMMNRLTAQRGKSALSPHEREAVRKAALDRLILEELAYQKARADGINADPAEVDKSIDKLRAMLGGDEALRQRLASQNSTEEELRRDIARGIILQQIFAREVYDSIVISEDDLKGEYEKEKDKFVNPETVMVTDTVFFLDPEERGSHEIADRTLKKILADKDRNPWNLTLDGTFVVYDNEIKKGKQVSLYNEALKLKPGDLSGVLKMSDSLHIIKLKAYTPEKRFTLEEVRGQLEGKLRAEAQQKRLQQWQAALNKEATIVILYSEGSAQ